MGSGQQGAGPATRSWRRRRPNNAGSRGGQAVVELPEHRPHSAGFTAGYAAVEGAECLFLLPVGRPRRFGVCSDDLAAAIHAGGRPRRFPLPSARRSMLRIASSS